ncbi:15452_t:CDS:1, partial [Funneliformis geosporum]
SESEDKSYKENDGNDDETSIQLLKPITITQLPIYKLFIITFNKER